MTKNTQDFLKDFFLKWQKKFNSGYRKMCMKLKNILIIGRITRLKRICGKKLLFKTDNNKSLWAY